MSDVPEKAVVIGASAGALEALSVILPQLPADVTPPVMIVVHVPPDKRSVLSELFQAKCRVAVLEAEDKEPIRSGTVYFAPPDYHLLVETNGLLSLSSDEPVLFSRPSIDVLFESAADAYGAGLTAVVLSGANQDGAQGLASVVEAGGTAIVQDPDTAFASAMPQAAVAMCPTALIMSLEEIATYLQKARSA
ncbi:chemotaxis protein CheB [Pararhizobium arenae]|uniref:chemotaxis protein CheB n=1 Tax=Pararhizobium arenae TaxID=1856850 RepID=UPI00094B0D28|nr:chemotaxis protein CheB [Pararhizobium arenae]